MTCITKILELKGDKEFLPVNSRIVIEGGGSYKGIEYLITFTEMGTRCGYVAISEPFDYDDIDCHGGLTFFSQSHSAKKLLDIACDDIWIGFDAAHAYDGRSKNTVLKYFGETKLSDSFFDCVEPFTIHRTYNFMENECQSIIDQLIKKNPLMVTE